MSRIFELTMTREGPLIAFETWMRGSNASCLKLGMSPKAMPFEFLVNRDGLVADYIEPRIDEEYCAWIVEQLRSDPTYLDREFAQYEVILAELVENWKTQKPVDDFKTFFERACEGWHGLLLAYMGGGDPLLAEPEREKALAMRKRGETYFEALSAIVERHLTLHCASAIAQQKDRFYISIDELLSGSLPSVEVLARRRNFYFLTDDVLHEDGLDAYLAKCDVVLEGSADTVTGNVHRFRGMVACPGSITGSVRVLYRKEEIPTFLDGEILVTAMTTPDYLPAVQRAVGIITDEGGITCHAAIVARELGKPCLIGTKVATQVLRTGMIVELDANAGSVRILK